MTQVSIIAVRVLVEAVASAGVPRQQFLAEAGLRASQLDDRNACLDLAAYRRVLRAALVTSGNPALGLYIGEHAGTAHFDVVGYLAEQSGCLREALQTSARYVRILTEGPEVEIHEQGDAATICCRQICDGLPEVQLTAEFAMTWMLRLVRQFVGDSAQVRRAFFPYAAPAHRAEYTRVFGGQEQFSHAFTGLELERSWLDRARRHRSPELWRLLVAQAESQLARRDRDAPPTQRVKRWLSSQSLQTRPTMETVARDLGMSARSLRRQLSGERVMYSDLVEDARATRAKQLLEDPRCSVQEAAYALGFETPAAFSRAFRRWTGMPPSAYRLAR